MTSGKRGATRQAWVARAGADGDSASRIWGSRTELNWPGVQRSEMVWGRVDDLPLERKATATFMSFSSEYFCLLLRAHSIGFPCRLCSTQGVCVGGICRHLVLGSRPVTMQKQKAGPKGAKKEGGCRDSAKDTHTRCAAVATHFRCRRNHKVKEKGQALTKPSKTGGCRPLSPPKSMLNHRCISGLFGGGGKNLSAGSSTGKDPLGAWRSANGRNEFLRRKHVMVRKVRVRPLPTEEFV